MDITTKSVTAKCIFCGASVVPIMLHGGNWDWGCMACGGRNTGWLRGTLTGEVVTEYLDGRKSTLKSIIHCPIGLLFVNDWEAL